MIPVGIRFLWLIFFCFSLAGCYRLSIQAFGSESILLNQESILKGQKFTLIRRFYREQPLEYVFGYSEVENRVLEQIVQQETEGHAGVGIVNLRIQRSYRPVDALVALLTLGIFTRNLLIVEGDIIHWHAAHS